MDIPIFGGNFFWFINDYSSSWTTFNSCCFVGLSEKHFKVLTHISHGWGDIQRFQVKTCSLFFNHLKSNTFFYEWCIPSFASLPLTPRPRRRQADGALSPQTTSRRARCGQALPEWLQVARSPQRILRMEKKGGWGWLVTVSAWGWGLGGSCEVFKINI